MSLPPLSQAAANRVGLACVLLTALAVRLWSVATHTYIAFPDETFQYLEPAHRLAFGAGAVTWEFLDGIRSWLLPAAVAGVMRLVALFDSDPESYILVLRLLCVLASLNIPYVGYRMVERRCGLGPAIAAGLLCALSPQAVYFAPLIMTEPLVTDLGLLAICLGDRVRAQPLATRRLLLIGAMFGLAAALRYQYAPVLGLVVLLQHARDARGFLIVAGAGTIVVALVLGVLDWIVWGAPFQSVWLNYIRNGTQGVSTAMGVEIWSYYFEYFVAAWGPMTPVLLACILMLSSGGQMHLGQPRESGQMHLGPSNPFAEGIVSRPIVSDVHETSHGPVRTIDRKPPRRHRSVRPAGGLIASARMRARMRLWRGRIPRDDPSPPQ